MFTEEVTSGASMATPSSRFPAAPSCLGLSHMSACSPHKLAGTTLPRTRSEKALQMMHEDVSPQPRLIHWFAHQTQGVDQNQVPSSEQRHPCPWELAGWEPDRCCVTSPAQPRIHEQDPGSEGRPAGGAAAVANACPPPPRSGGARTLGVQIGMSFISENQKNESLGERAGPRMCQQREKGTRGVEACAVMRCHLHAKAGFPGSEVGKVLQRSSRPSPCLCGLSQTKKVDWIHSPLCV